jgi:hypothetical protein
MYIPPTLCIKANWNWSSRQHALVYVYAYARTNHMHVADLIITQQGNSLPVRTVSMSANSTGKEFGGRFRSWALIKCTTIPIQFEDAPEW